MQRRGTQTGISREPWAGCGLGGQGRVESCLQSGLTSVFLGWTPYGPALPLFVAVVRVAS